jgi:hypothetical protein
MPVLKKAYNALTTSFPLAGVFFPKQVSHPPTFTGELLQWPVFSGRISPYLRSHNTILQYYCSNQYHPTHGNSLSDIYPAPT